MRKLKKVLSVLMCAVCLTLIASCDTTKKETASKKPELAKSLVQVVDNLVIITVDDDYFEITDKTVLLDYMQALKTDGAIDFTVKDGMITAINGQENPVDWSKCWMLYSNDSELSNEAWGTVTVDGITYFSAVLGAEGLPIKDGKIYVWEFKSF